MKTYTIATVDDRGYRNSVGKIIKNETERGTVLHLHLAMFPQTKFLVTEDKREPKNPPIETL